MRLACLAAAQTGWEKGLAQMMGIWICPPLGAHLRLPWQCLAALPPNSRTLVRVPSAFCTCLALHRDFPSHLYSVSSHNMHESLCRGKGFFMACSRQHWCLWGCCVRIMENAPELLSWFWTAPGRGGLMHLEAAAFLSLGTQSFNSTG